MMNRFFQSLDSRLFMSATPLVHAELSGEDHALPKPSNLTAVVVGQNVTLNWADHSTNETGFAIYRRSKTGPVQVGTVAANVTTFAEAGAPVGMDTYFVRALRDNVFSAGSNRVDVKVEAAVTVKAPTKLKSKGLSTTSIGLSWEGDRGAVGGFVIERSPNGNDGWTLAGTTDASTRAFVDTGLTAGTRYIYRITAVGANGATARSAVLIGQTKANEKGDKAKHDDRTPERVEAHTR